MSSLRIHLLGNVRVDHDELPAEMSKGRAVKALLGYTTKHGNCKVPYFTLGECAGIESFTSKFDQFMKILGHGSHGHFTSIYKVLKKHNLRIAK